jgi:hypothetical protein
VRLRVTVYWWHRFEGFRRSKRNQFPRFEAKAKKLVGKNAPRVFVITCQGCSSSPTTERQSLGASKAPESREKRNDICAARLTVAVFGSVFQAIDQIHFRPFGYVALSG